MSLSRISRIRKSGMQLQRNFQHMDPNFPNMKGSNLIPGELERAPKYLRPKDRVKQFNITVGDSVLVTKGDKQIRRRIGTVDRLDRTRNLVFLKEPEFCRKLKQTSNKKGYRDPSDPDNTVARRPRPIHYSNLKLIGRSTGDSEDYVRVAARTTGTTASWSLRRHAFSWARKPESWKLLNVAQDGTWRYGERTVLKGPTAIPWPEEGSINKTRPIYNPGPTETKQAAASKDSFVPLATPFHRLIPELQLPQRELGGTWNSRANRIKRWNERNRDPKTGKIIARTPTFNRRFAKINWDKPTKNHPQGLQRPAKMQQQQAEEQVQQVQQSST